MKREKTPLDFDKLPPETLLREAEFLRARGGPVPFGRTHWRELVAAGKAPTPAMRQPRATLWAWADIRDFLRGLSNRGGA